MKLLDNIARRFGYVQKRNADYAAAQLSRLTASWASYSLSANEEIFRSLRTLRARSRELARNDAHAKRFLQMVEINVVGPDGIRLQNRAVDYKDGKAVPDRIANATIEREFAKWGRRGVCEVTGRLSFTALQRLIIRTVARDGEILIRRLRSAKRNRYGYQLQVLDADRLDERYNEDLSNGNRVCMGIEINREGRPVAYHILDSHPGDYRGSISGETKRERVPASDIWHDFVADRPEQIRGMPWMHAAMLRLNMLGAFEESAIIAARVGASKMGFFETPDGNAGSIATDKDDATGQHFEDMEPGLFGTLAPGEKFVGWDPKYPDQNFDPFVKACLRGVASGLGVSYNSLASDLEGVSYSSIRQGVMDERDTWKTLQSWLAEGTLETVYGDWLTTSLLAGAFLTPAKLEKFNAATWQPRRWQWVDPLKDVQANVEAINNGLKSRTQVIMEQGDDIEEVFSLLGEEQELADLYGVKLGAPAPAAPAAADTEPQAD